MRTVIRNSYTPKLGDYCNTLVVDKETGNQYLFDKDGVWTLLSLDGDEVIAEAVAQANAYTDDVAEGKVDKEEGKGLSENDFTDEDKDKLERVQENVIEVVKRNGVALPVTNKTVDVEVPTATSALTNDSGYITNAVDNLVNYYDKDETDTLLETEALTRDAADQDLQEQIDAISSASDVVDVVGTYAELQNYDTSSLSENDIIKVLSDSTHDDATTYYRWTNNQFTYIGSEGPFYTKGEADATFVPLTRTINGKGLNSDVVLTAADVNALPASTVIPTVNDATLTIQKNGSTVQTFTANQATNATANITVPTKTSDLTNDGSDNTSTYVESDELAPVATSGSYNDLTDKPTIGFELVEMSYGESNAWAKFIDAYQGHKIVYCRASSNSNPASGSQTRKAFMAYVNNAENPTEVEFQYVRSVGTKTASQPVDQIFVYTLKSANGGTWTVTTRDMGPKLAAGTNTTVSYANGTYTISATQPTVNDATLTIKKNGSSVGTFTANSSTNTDVDITVPTKTSDLTNDSGFITKNVSDLTNYYTQSEVNGMFNALSIPTKTSDLVNDSGFLTSIPIASATTLGGVKIGSGLNVAADGTISAAVASLDWANITNKPTDVSYWTNDAGYITSAALPTKTSDLTNDSGFITSASLPTKTSDLTNDSGFITNSVSNLTNYYTKSQTYTQGEVNSLLSAITVPTKTSDLTNDGADGTSTYVEADQLATVATSGSYNDLSNKPTIPAAQVNSDWNATSGKAQILNKPTLATVATSGSYNDLSNKPTIPAAQVQSNWTQTTTTAVDYIKNKPTLAAVATSGSYNDLSNKPTIPTVNNATLTIQRNNTNVATFTANASSNVTANITVPTNTNELTNGAGFITSSGTAAKANQLTTARTIAISGGATGTATSFNGTANISIPVTDVKDAYVTWGGRSLASDITPDDMGCIDEFGHNKLAFLPASCIEIKYSTDGGSTWVDYGASDANKVKMVSTAGPGFYVGGSTNNATASNIANLKLRVRIAAGPTSGGKVYTAAKKILINVSTQGCSGNKVDIKYRTIANYKAGTETWTTVGTYDVSGGSGWNSIPFAYTFGGSFTSQTSQMGQIEFVFYSSGLGTWGLKKLSAIDFRMIGSTNWTMPSEMARAGHLYTVDEGQNATFPANVGVTGSLKHGSYTYTLPNKTGTVAMTSDIPSVPTVNNGQLTIQKNGSNVATFTANQSGNATANITVPTTVAELSDAGNYATNTALNEKQDTLTAGSHISISNDTISATGYVHSENPVTAASSTATVTGSMIATGTITADKLASGATIKLTLSTTDIGEGAALAANTLYGVYQ